jgi:hypothetical protein
VDKLLQAGVTRVLLLALLVLAAPPGGLGYVFNEYVIDIRPSDGLTSESIQFTLVNDQDEVLEEGSYTIGAVAQNVGVYDGMGLIQFESSKQQGTTVISYQYRTPLARGEQATITIEFDAEGIVGKSTYSDESGTQEDRVVSTGFAAPAPIGDLLVRVHLPEGAWLARSLSEHMTITGSPIQPLDGAITSNGTSLAIGWSRSDVSMGDRFDVFVAYRMPGSPGAADRTIVWLTLAAGVALGGSIVYLLSRRRTTETKTQHTLALLEAGERRVLKEIMNSGGEIRQDDLIKVTDYSRARVSQLVTHLEKLGLIRKERFERTNKLYLTGEVRET